MEEEITMDQEKPIVAILQPRGTNTWHVYRGLHLGKKATDPLDKSYPYCREYHTNKEVVEAVARGDARFGIVAIETLRGTVFETMDAIIDVQISSSDNQPRLSIVEELRVPISHALLAAHPYALHEIKCVRSHEQALIQCDGWLNREIPHAKRESRPSTMYAAEELKSESIPGVAAIGDKEFARQRGLSVLRERIEDNPSNMTRFLQLMHVNPDWGQIGLRTPDDGYRTAILAHLVNEPGAIYNLLEPLARRKLNVTNGVEKRPTRRHLGEYVFWVEFLGYTNEPEVAAAINEMRSRTAGLHCLGSFGITHMDPWGKILFPKGRTFYYPKEPGQEHYA